MRFTKTLLTLVFTTGLASGFESKISDVRRHASQFQSIRSISTLAKDHQLVLFVSSRCHWCHKFAPIVQSISDAYGLAVKVISFDGKPVKPFNQVIEAKKENFRFFFKDQPPFAPVLFLQHTKTKHFEMLAEGATPKKELIKTLQFYAQQGGIISCAIKKSL